MDRRTFLATAAATVLAPRAAGAQAAQTDTARALRVEWQRSSERPGIEGHVYNGSPYRIGGVRLRIVRLDGAGAGPAESFGWVYGNVPAGGRWPFFVRVGRSVEIREVTVESFYLVALEPPAESP
jgi:hypothetical protein